ncbi:3-hydroxyacyl-CoA dehydrogenase family protein [Saccharothrix longispora]|uniref:3-hydroxyacyl-CoA dehydrogenase family protein n=1 Tax=Saccharothrix longispora TaxID=33920 RepID=UPI0028FD6BC5|nr:3-hydroxyacyl-CoA dehydrogenase NAD-binding domain-containing protein [Saccharothrix longispora]MDU0288174.1 3-hydroxyacyl-CoA dehydrogenase NAD-binding domain-containing protein [Saccharothrix longispora]
MAAGFNTAWVVGLGSVGCATAVLLAKKGIRVVGVESGTATLTTANRRISQLVHAEARAGAHPIPWTREVLQRIEFTTRMDRARPADIVFEAVPENLTAKTDVLSTANTHCRPDTVFATATMALSVTGIASRSGRMPRTVGLTLRKPGQVATGTVVELACTPVTDRDVRTAVREFVQDLDLVPVEVPDQAGFIGNALLLGYLNNAAAMYGAGYASRDDIDTAMTLGCGLPIGPLAQLDRMGIDAVLDGLTALHERTGSREHRPAPLLTTMAAAGLLGEKTGNGFYQHPAGAPSAGTAAPALSASRPVGRVGVIGAGTMATGIAEVLATAGYATTLVARNGVRAKEARVAVERSLERRVRRGRMTGDALDASIDRLTCQAEFGAVAECDVVIEAVVEDIAVKREVFRALDRLTRAGSVLMTTTSSLSVLDCATATGRPEDVVGMHFFNPAPAMRLVEVVRTFLTAPDAVATARALATALGKRPVDCTDRTGFVVNALLFPYLNNAVTMVEQRHVTVADVDRVMTEGHGYPMGPFRLLDAIGLDVSLVIQRSLHEALADPALAPARYLTDLVRAGHLGRKNGRGFHGYETV